MLLISEPSLKTCLLNFNEEIYKTNGAYFTDVRCKLRLVRKLFLVINVCAKLRVFDLKQVLCLFSSFFVGNWVHLEGPC